MGSTWGNTIKISIFGESHGTGIGVVIDGFPSGVAYDEAFVLREMERRAPGRNKQSTARKEPDRPEIQSGIYNGKNDRHAYLCRPSATPISVRTTTPSWRRSRVPVTRTIRVCCATIPATTREAAAISPAD